MLRQLLLVFLTIFCSFLPSQAAAEKGLISMPLPKGEGGLICSCTNLKAKSIDVIFRFTGNGGSQVEWLDNIPAGGVGQFQPIMGDRISNCSVYRLDGQDATTSQLYCVLSAIDSLGNPTSTAPVNKKIKMQDIPI